MAYVAKMMACSPFFLFFFFFGHRGNKIICAKKPTLLCVDKGRGNIFEHTQKEAVVAVIRFGLHDCCCYQSCSHIFFRHCSTASSASYHRRFPRHNDQHKMTTTRKAILAFATEEEHAENAGNLFMGMDFGTSGCRVSLIDERGVQKFETSVRYTDTREANATTSSSSMTAIWEDALWTSLENIPRQIRERIVSVAIDGTSGTVIIVHPDSGEPLYKAMMQREV